MYQIVKDVFKTGSLAQGSSYPWPPLGRQLLAETIITLTYLIISSLIFYIAKKRNRLIFTNFFLLFSTLIFTAFLAHLILMINTWHPIKRLEIFVWSLNVLACLSGLILLLQLVARLLPGNKEWRKVNDILLNKIEQLKEKDKTIEKIKEFEFLSDSLPEIIWTADSVGNINYCNKNWYNFTGLNFEQTTDWKWQSVIHPEDLSECVELWKESLKTGKAFKTEYRFKKFDGSYRWFLGKAKPMKDEAGNITKWIGCSSDIHDQKLMQEELLLKNQQLEAFKETAIEETKKNSQILNGILTNMPVIVFRVNKEGIIKESRGAGLKVLGLKDHEIVGQSAIKLFPEKIHRIQDSLTLNIPVNFGSEGILNDREWHLDSYIFNDTTTEEGGIIGFSLDITDKKTTEKKLRESEEKFHAIFTHTFHFTGLMDADGTLLEANKTALNLVGLERADVVGKPFWETKWWSYSKKSKERLIEAIREASSGKFVRYEVETLTNNNRLLTVDFSVKPVFDENNNVKWLIAEGRDITDIKITNQAIQKKSQILNGILTNMPVLVYRLSPKGYIRELHGAIYQHTGFQPEEVIGKNIMRLLPHFKESLAKILKEKTGVLETNGKTGDLEWHFQNYYFPDEINPGGVIGFAWDILEKKQFEQELMRARKHAESANISKTRFLANMSHEIRTPLNAILGFANLIKKSNLNNDQREEYSSFISSSGNILLKLIEDILDLSKIEEGKLTLNCSSFEVKETIERNLFPYKIKANEKSIDFNISIDPTIPPYLIGDSHRINQILINLIGNALKFTRAGKIQVDVAVQEKTSEDILLRFSVLDTGIGIPTEKQNVIFEPFSQVDESISKEYGGSGLGLAIVKQLISLMKGKIFVESPTYTGTASCPGTKISFELKLQIDKTSKHLKPYPKKEKVYKFSKEIRVLVTEDNMVNQKLARIILNQIGCKGDFASNGIEAINLFKQHQYDIILMDIQMPLMNGYETTRMIREVYNANLPIIGLSANVFEDDIDKCLKVGMNDHLGKPFDEKQVFEIIDKWVSAFKTDFKKIGIPHEQ